MKCPGGHSVWWTFREGKKCSVDVPLVDVPSKHLIWVSSEYVAIEFGLHSHWPASCLAITRTIWSEWTWAWYSFDLVLRLLASDNKDQPPLPDYLNVHLIWVDLNKVTPLGFAQYITWVHNRIPQLILATLSYTLLERQLNGCMCTNCSLYHVSYNILINCCYFFSNRLCPIIAIIMHYSDTGHVFQVFWSHKQ
jgi:hypothetical protein